MQLTITPDIVLLFAVLAQAVFAAGLLWFAPHNQLPNRFLALLLLTIALWVLDGLWRASGLYGQNAEWYFTPIYYSLAFGPLLYFYVQSLVSQPFRLHRRHLWHFGPVLVQGALYWWLRFQPYATRLWFWEQVHQPYTYRVEFIGTWISLIVYLALSLRLLRRYQRWLPDNFSELSQLRLQWLQVLLLALGMVSVQWLVEVVLREFFQLYYAYDYSTWLLGGVVLLIGVVGLRQADMRAVHFAPPEATQKAPQPISAASLHGEATGGLFAAASDADVVAVAPTVQPAPAAVDAAVLERIRRALEEEQLYLNPTLTLAELSAHTGLAARLISFTVNNGFGQSFNDLVNGYRVEAVKRRLANPADVARLTLLGIAFECGFNSKTTFNRIFKQFTGAAPSEFAPQ
ncbi:helix-turn-helix transcriptional regulator [Hymenobacter sp. BT188]|uniref:helix-turn-helix domain-containing protein n=1 Tax=Hymenobacter sp. BT188 TaxID=2763504 RepID=UPI00165159C0|nr:helix-turn-helix domain-containing protein [Hymenobacter sp. BT188]MBC6606717.1 helix-turn-helix transcriptional regulator [Hymenobacter sp. BT188]